RWAVGTENQDFVPFPAIDPAHIHHDHVHADIADDRGRLSLDRYRSLAVPILPADAVGMAQGQGGCPYLSLGTEGPVVAHGLIGIYLMDLGDNGSEGGDGPKLYIHFGPV